MVDYINCSYQHVIDELNMQERVRSPSDTASEKFQGLDDQLEDIFDALLSLARISTDK